MRLAALIWVLWAGGAAAQGFAALEGHGGPVMDVAISADGRHALTASFDNSVGYWDIASGEVTWLDGHEASVKAAIFAGNGLAASAGDDFAVEVWDLSSGTSRFRLEGHRGQVKDLALSPDGTELASAGWDGRVGLWDIAAGRHKRWIEGHQGAVNDVAYAGGRLFTASADGTIRSWDPATGAPGRVLVRHGFGVTSLLIDEAAGWLAYGAVDGGTRIIDLQTDAVIADLTLDRRPVLDIAADPAMTQIAVGDGQGHIMVVETQGWDIVHDFRVATQGPVWALAYDHAGRILAGGIDDAAHFWPVGAKEGGPIMGDRPGFLRDPGSMSNGERQFRRKCSICHSLTDDGVRRAGPSLAGLFGRRAGSLPGYVYSDTVANAAIVWNAETIDRLFDLGPEHYIPGTKMPAQRIADPADRADLIRFLREHTEG